MLLYKRVNLSRGQYGVDKLKGVWNKGLPHIKIYERIQKL